MPSLTRRNVHGTSQGDVTSQDDVMSQEGKGMSQGEKEFPLASVPLQPQEFFQLYFKVLSF